MGVIQHQHHMTQLDIIFKSVVERRTTTLLFKNHQWNAFQSKTKEVSNTYASTSVPKDSSHIPRILSTFTPKLSIQMLINTRSKLLWFDATYLPFVLPAAHQPSIIEWIESIESTPSSIMMEIFLFQWRFHVYHRLLPILPLSFTLELVHLLSFTYWLCHCLQ